MLKQKTAYDMRISDWSSYVCYSDLFQSVSSHIDHPGLLQDDRRLLFLRLKKDFTLAEELFVSARLEPFYDFDGEYADYSMSLYLVYQGFFGKVFLPRERQAAWPGR